MADVEKIIIKEQSYPVKDVNAVSLLEQSLTAEQKAQVQANIGVTAATNVYTKSETDTLLNGKISTTAKGTSNGVAELDSNGKVPSSQLPSFVDDVVEGYYKTDNDRFYEESTFTTLIEPVAGKSWVDIPTNKSYRWTGSAYVRVDEGVQIGETADTAYAGNKGKANADAITAIKDGTSIDSFGDVETALADKISKSQTAGLVKNDGTIDTTNYVSDISGKADKVSGATNGNFAGLDANGNLVDSGKNASDFAQVQSDWAQSNSSEMDFIKNKPPLVKGGGYGGNMIGGTGANTNTTRYANSVAYGNSAVATANYAFAFGDNATAGNYNRSTGKHAVAIGNNVSAEKDYEFAYGKFNQSNADTVFSIGDGTSDSDRHNLMELKTDGSLLLNGNETAIKNDVDAVNKRCDDIIDIIEDKTVIYGFHVNPSESDPADAVTYLADAVGMTPAAMGTTTFNYGSWKNAFFMPQPCMLKYDGTVDYYLDPNDYSKKLDGTASDISDYSYNGNAMIEFPKLWFKFESGAAEGEGYFYVSNKQVDSSYHCYANYDADGNQTDHFYMSIYNGVIYDGKMRSLSGKKLSSWSTTAYSSSATYAVDNVVNYDGRMWKCVTAVETAEAFDPTKWEQFGFNGNTTGQQEVDAAVANDTTAKSEWYIDVWCDRVLITALLYLMGKSLDLQSTYGRGIDSGSQTAAENYVTGTANDKGLFYGVTADGNSVVKVFGIENFWALKFRRTAGCIGKSDGTVAYKMTSSAVDGSTATSYNTDGTGYLIDNTVRPSNGYVSKMGFGNWGLIPRSVAGGNSNVYYCDYFFTNNVATTFTLVGGASDSSLYCGFFVYLGYAFTDRSWVFAVALSCKPLANRGE